MVLGPGTPPPRVVSIGSCGVAPSGGCPSVSVVSAPFGAVTTSPGVSSRSTFLPPPPSTATRYVPPGVRKLAFPLLPSATGCNVEKLAP
jgi:hypothetical protein